MFWPLSFLAIVLANAAPAKMPAPQPMHAHLMLAAWEAPPAYDAHAEKELLDMANRARVQAGLAPFGVDDGLTHAAREHATAMAQRQELSHQFSGEPELSQRLAASCSLYLVEAAENVASAESADRAHDGLMHSVHHRENLLHPSYNVVGIGVVRREDTLYVVQDFGDSEVKSSAKEFEAAIAQSTARLRAQAKLPDLPQREALAARQEACAMSTADSLKVPQSSAGLQGKHVIRYTTLQPGTLPAAVVQAAADDTLKSYAAGSCFARSKSYPNGVYWVVLVFY
jgi:uncharacterized protein YkwD